MQLIEKGITLSQALSAKASEFHAKSTAHEVILWESVGIDTCVSDMRNGNIEARHDVKYKNIEWGASLQEYSPELAEKVRDFYKEYYYAQCTK